jgi:hypothetical protein
MKDHCECDFEAKMPAAMAAFYDSISERPFVNHAPGECKCTNLLQEYERDGKKVTLCSCCFTSSDKEVTTANTKDYDKR